MPRLDFGYANQDDQEPTVLLGRRPSETMPDRYDNPTFSAGITGLNRPYFLEKAKEVEGRCSCCGTELEPEQSHCPVCNSVNSRIGSDDEVTK